MVIKKTQIKHLFRMIKKNKVSFMAVAFIAAMSIACFLGYQNAANAMLLAGDYNFEKYNLHSLEIASANGITEEDIEAISKWEQVSDVEGGYTSIVLVEHEGQKLIVQVRTALERMNVPVVLEGTLPSASNEVAVEEMFAREQNVKVGDTITLEHIGELLNDSFVITAIINEPAYCSTQNDDTRGTTSIGGGGASYYIQVQKEAFDANYYNGCYTVAYVKSNSLEDLYYYSDEYTKQETEFKESLETLGKERAQIRYESLREEVQKAIDEQKAKLELAGVPITDEILQKLNEPLEQIELKEWVVTIRNYVGDIQAIEVIVEGLFGISYSYAIIFLVVAIVVCHSSISRMIDEQRILIGAQKALGFSSKEVLTHYMLYNGVCALLSVVLGWIFSFGVVEVLILKIFKKDFVMDIFYPIFLWKEAIGIAVIFVIMFLGASYMACSKLVKLPAITLLRGELPANNKPFFFEGFKFYKRLSLYTRTMIKNVLHDKNRMLTNIVGIMGGIALLVISFSTKFSISGASDRQLNEYFLYQNRLIIDTRFGTVEDFEEVLNQEEISYIRVQDKLKSFRVDGGKWQGAHMLTFADDQKIKEFMFLENVETKTTIDTSEEGVWISYKSAENYGLKAGDVIEVMDSQGTPKEMKIAGVIQHYLSYNMIVTTEAYYETIMGTEVDDCVLLLKGNIDGLYDKVNSMDGFLTLKDNSDLRIDTKTYDLIVMICIILSAIMALLVQLNQIVMHINRKSRELAVMRINGFTLKETKSFVYKDNIILTVVGMLFGWGAGLVFAEIVITMLESTRHHYIHEPSILACLCATCIGVAFAIGVNVIALRRINRLNLTNVSAN